MNKDATIRQLYTALELAYSILGNKLGYAYDGPDQWDEMDTIKAALSQCDPDVTDEN